MDLRISVLLIGLATMIVHPFLSADTTQKKQVSPVPAQDGDNNASQDSSTDQYQDEESYDDTMYIPDDDDNNEDADFH